MAIVKNRTKISPSRSQPKRLTAEEIQEQQTEKFWDEVDQLAQEKINQLLTSNIPFQNVALITEPYRYEDAQQKKVGLFLDRDVDYRTLLSDISSQYDEEDLPSSEYLAEEIAVWYVRMVIKALLSDLSQYSCYDPSYFEDLNQE